MGSPGFGWRIHQALEAKVKNRILNGYAKSARENIAAVTFNTLKGDRRSCRDWLKKTYGNAMPSAIPMQNWHPYQVLIEQCRCIRRQSPAKVRSPSRKPSDSNAMG